MLAHLSSTHYLASRNHSSILAIQTWVKGV